MGEEKPISEMTTDEILENIKRLRMRRAQAQERRKAGVSTPEEKLARKSRGTEAMKITGALGDVFDDIFNEPESPEKKALDSALDDLTQ